LNKNLKEQAVNEMKQHDTTITMHLFGRRGRDSLSFDQFQMCVLKTEIFFTKRQNNNTWIND
jgi:hypothetical protein